MESEKAAQQSLTPDNARKHSPVEPSPPPTQLQRSPVPPREVGRNPHNISARILLAHLHHNGRKWHVVLILIAHKPCPNRRNSTLFGQIPLRTVHRVSQKHVRQIAPCYTESSSK